MAEELPNISGCLAVGGDGVKAGGITNPFYTYTSTKQGGHFASFDNFKTTWMFDLSRSNSKYTSANRVRVKSKQTLILIKY